MPAVLTHPILGSQAPVDTDNRCRSLYGIIWSCLATIFLCTFLHPNVPPAEPPRPEEGFVGQDLFTRTWQKLRRGFFACPWRKLRMILIALIAPELILGFAARQYFTAHWFARKTGVSMTHAFLLIMGGFVTRDGHHPIVIRKEPQISQYLGKIEQIKEEDIKDRSKADGLANFLKLTQVVWFTVHCVARLMEGLPVSQLETATTAYTAFHIVIWISWRKKPLDVSEAILIDFVYPGHQVVASPRYPARVDQHDEDDAHSSEDSDGRTLLDDAREKPLDGSPAKRWEPEAKVFDPRLTVGDRLNAILNASLLGRYPNFNPMASTSVPPFWSTPYREGPDNLPLILLVQLICVVLFGVVLCSAWNTSFPSIIEMWMWKISALLITGLPLACFLLLLSSNVFEPSSLPRRILTYFNYGLMVIYVIARVALLALAFTTLRDLPPSILVDVEWTSVLPHI